MDILNIDNARQTAHVTSSLLPIGPIGTPLTKGAVRILLLGAGELGKEVAIEAQRLGVEVIAVDRYADAPAMQVAHRSYVIDMLDADALRTVIAEEQPHLVVPEVEAIATDQLVALEADGQRVVPTARATHLTMNREGIRRLAAEELGLPTSPYRFASTTAEYDAAIAEIGVPCVVKPVMSSSGKGQSTVSTKDDASAAWEYARDNARVPGQPVIVEGFVEFDYEITLLTVRHVGGVTFCAPIGHRQVDGDYRESWQPQAMSDAALAASRDVAEKVTGALGGWGVFGVELFVRGDDVLFSEVSPRPHDTGMVTMITQPASEFALHARAILGLPIREDDVAIVAPGGAGASSVVLSPGVGVAPVFDGVADALRVPTAQVRLFGKPDARKNRRLGVTLAAGATTDEARERANAAAAAITVRFGDE
jgi:phosphoribosylglycinamide formyltransferase 2